MQQELKQTNNQKP